VIARMRLIPGTLMTEFYAEHGGKSLERRVFMESTMYC